VAVVEAYFAFRAWEGLRKLSLKLPKYSRAGREVRFCKHLWERKKINQQIQAHF